MKPSLVSILAAVALAMAWAAGAQDLEDRAHDAAEQYLQGAVDEGHIEELARNLSFWDKLRLITLRRSFRPYFSPIEAAVRNLARAPDPDAVSEARDRVKDTMHACWTALVSARHDDAAEVWQRGLLVLILLDRAWRKRNQEAGQREVQNRFDLPKLFDTLNREIGIPAPP